MRTKVKSRVEPVSFTILGEPASKSNSRRLVSIRGRPRFIKSQKALDYLKGFADQCPVLDPLFELPVKVEMDIYYGSNRPDLDESLILDAMQKRIYRNDRQVRRKIIGWGGVSEEPRAIIRVSPLESGDCPSDS